MVLGIWTLFVGRDGLLTIKQKLHQLMLQWWSRSRKDSGMNGTHALIFAMSETKQDKKKFI